MEPGKSPRCWSTIEPSEERGLDGSSLAKGSTSQSKDMGPTCKHVVAFIGNIMKQVRSICEGVRVVVGDETPLGGVAQVVLDGVRVIEVDVLV